MQVTEAWNTTVFCPISQSYFTFNCLKCVSAQLPHIKVIREPSSDQSDGNADPKFENEDARERGWREMASTKFPKDIQSSAPVGQRVPKSAYQSPKLKNLFAAISDCLFWGQGMSPCCYEKNALYSAVMVSGTVIFAVWLCFIF